MSTNGESKKTKSKHSALCTKLQKLVTPHFDVYDTQQLPRSDDEADMSSLDERLHD